jgi:hypothetical protein
MIYLVSPAITLLIIPPLPLPHTPHIIQKREGGQQTVVQKEKTIVLI